MGKTIKQIAEEIGVSKQAVRDEIDKQSLQSTLQRKGNTFFVPKDSEFKIKSAFLERKTEKLTEKSKELVGGNVSDELVEAKARIRELELQLKLKGAADEEKIAIYKDEIAHLKDELDKRDEHINNLISQISDIGKLTLQAQTLHAGTIQDNLLKDSSTEEAKPKKKRFLFFKR